MKGAISSINAALFNLGATTICCGHTMIAIVLLPAMTSQISSHPLFGDIRTISVKFSQILVFVVFSYMSLKPIRKCDIRPDAKQTVFLMSELSV